ncbi:AAA family ATPase [Enterobacteriaceae bacterium BIT-l23]|uniref:ATPase n=1 Tax=Jejubacter calystegiae TaxID=2579935 RepID=A0A4P8YL00_9ENTR|nr:AAA family ATPase [Jejubacter calystegiae]NUU66449.1 AAA family ATPase [Enterobacteriaceae bacterium BIT-l23]QCT21461.1 ATPase [Jejubacter calystegiae]
MNLRYILTGGPGAGKSTLLQALSDAGIATQPESGRAIIREQQQQGGNALPWADRLAFAMRMLERDIDGWKVHENATAPVLFDRGIPDSLGYLQLCGLDAPPRMTNAVRDCRYAPRVFFAPPWRDIYRQDDERRQSWDEAAATARVMLRLYRACGYQVVMVPPLTAAARARWLRARLITG